MRYQWIWAIEVTTSVTEVRGQRFAVNRQLIQECDYQMHYLGLSTLSENASDSRSTSSAMHITS